MGEIALLDEAMLAWFPPTGTVELSTWSTFTETDLRDISHLLHQSGKPSWSRIPRIYTTLRLINELDVIDTFLDRGITDLSLSFNQRTLPGLLKDQSSRVRFLDVQSRVLSKALDLEKEKSKHRHFSNPDDLPFKKVAELGKGGYGFVDKVLSTVSYREYAPKLIPRGRTFRQDRDLLRDFENELQVLKKLSHRHIVRLIGSYTDPHYVGVLMEPVADCNLKVLLSAHPLSPDTRSLVRTFYGCLASAVRYLHENKLRHKDIKPENVLVKSHEVYLTDFGTTLDWADTGHDTTTGLASKSTLRYAAPEVATNRPRNASADIWSLGCVFLEIWTELCQHSILELSSFMNHHGTKSSLYYANTSAVTEWCDMLSTGNDDDARIPCQWIRSMLEVEPSSRCSIQSLTEDIQTLNFGSDVTDSFLGLCCSGGHIATESVVSFNYQESIMNLDKWAAASSAFPSADTLLSSKEVLKHDVTSSGLTVKETGRSLNSGRLERESPIPRSEVTVPKRSTRLAGAQLYLKLSETTHEKVETARYADYLPEVDDQYSKYEAQHGVHQAQSTRNAPSLHAIEVSSLTPDDPPDFSNKKAHGSDDFNVDVATQQEYTHASGGSSEVDHSNHAKPLRTLQSWRQERSRNVRNQLPMLHLPTGDDRYTVNEVLRQWLANFDPRTYRNTMTVRVSSAPHSTIPMYELGEMRIPGRSCLLTMVVQAYDESDTWRKLHTRNPYLTLHRVSSNVVRNVWHTLDGLSVPWIEWEGGIVYFYPEDTCILPIYDDSDSLEMQIRRSFEYLKLMRYQILQWWYDCLTAPQHTWRERLREIKTYKIELEAPTSHCYVFQPTGLWYQHQISPDDPEQLPNTQRHIRAALHYVGTLRPIP